MLKRWPSRILTTIGYGSSQTLWDLVSFAENSWLCDCFFVFFLFFLFFWFVLFCCFLFFTNDENGCGSFTAFLCSGHFYVQEIMTAGANT